MIRSVNTRIIPRLDIKGPNLVKGIHLEGLRVMGRPEKFARYYYEQGADELLYIDVVASLYGRNSLLNVVESTAKEIFIPLTVGGGIRTLDDIRTVLKAGADKVAINTAAVKRPRFIREAAKRFGSSTIVVSIEANRTSDAVYEAYTENGRDNSGMDAVKWAVEAANMGAGEILITSVDREGTGLGYDLELTRNISKSVSIPVIASGGAGELSHIEDVVAKGFADAVSVASVLHYQYLDVNDNEEIFSEGNTEFLRSKVYPSKIAHFTIAEIKNHLIQCGIDCRVL